MARIRSVKPEFWTDSKTGTLSDRATKVFIALLNHSDDYGVLEFDLLAMKAKVYPYSKEDHLELIAKPLLEELLPKGLITMFAYSENNEPPFRPYLFIKNFRKHQKVDKPGKPLITGWKTGNTPNNFISEPPQFDEISPSVPREFAEYYANIRCGNRSRKGMEEERKGTGKEGSMRGGKLSSTGAVDNSPDNTGVSDGGNGLVAFPPSTPRPSPNEHQANNHAQAQAELEEIRLRLLAKVEADNQTIPHALSDVEKFLR